jgi:hypothetical protein
MGTSNPKVLLHIAPIPLYRFAANSGRSQFYSPLRSDREPSLMPPRRQHRADRIHSIFARRECVSFLRNMLGEYKPAVVCYGMRLARVERARIQLAKPRLLPLPDPSPMYTPHCRSDDVSGLLSQSFADDSADDQHRHVFVDLVRLSENARRVGDPHVEQRSQKVDLPFDRVRKNVEGHRSGNEQAYFSVIEYRDGMRYGFTRDEVRSGLVQFFDARNGSGDLV